MPRVLTFAEQLQGLLQQADDRYVRQMTALSQAINIMQDGQRRGAEDALQFLLDTLAPGQTPPPVATQADLDAQFTAMRTQAAGPLN